MNKIELHLRYKKETGCDREDPDTMDLSKEERAYIEWLEGIVQSVIDVDSEFVQTLRDKPRQIIVHE